MTADTRDEDDLLHHRLDLLVRETQNLRRARAVLSQLESGDRTDPEIVGEGRRSVELAEQAQRLGIRDAHRVGATTGQIADVTGLDRVAIDRLVDDA